MDVVQAKADLQEELPYDFLRQRMRFTALRNDGGGEKRGGGGGKGPEKFKKKTGKRSECQDRVHTT